MIIFPSGFLLTEDASAYPLKNARIGWRTWLRDLPTSAVSASSVAASSAADAPLRPDTWEFWQPSALPAWWLVDLGTAQQIDYVGIAGHTFGSSGCVVTVETSADGVTWRLFSGTAVTPTEDSPLLYLDDVQTHRYLRVSITGGAVLPLMAVVYAGLVLKMPRSIYGGVSPITLSRETVLQHSLSRGGQFLGQGFRRHGVTGSASFRHLAAPWYRANFDPFVQSARQFPFFFGWRPADYPREVAYAWSDDDIRPSNMGVRDFMQVSFKMQGIGHE